VLKASFEGKDGRKIMLLGLEKANVTRLKEGHPIKFDAKEMTGTELDVIIFYEDTTELMVERLKEAGLVLPDDVKKED
jgi:hypothetical protein